MALMRVLAGAMAMVMVMGGRLEGRGGWCIGVRGCARFTR